MRRRTPSLIALLLALAVSACLAVVVAVELRDAVPGTSPRAAIGVAAAARADARDAAFAKGDRRYEVAFDPAMVRDRVAWRMAPGDPLTTDLAIVNATEGADLAESARACAEWAGAKWRTRVQCYAFADSEAYEYKNITKDMDLAAPTAIVNLCWAVMASNARAGGPLEVNDMREAPQVWAAQQCPQGWAGAAPASSSSSPAKEGAA